MILKFALLYIDEIRPIIPDHVRDSLSNSMKDILYHTDLINPYSPSSEDGYLASAAAIQYLKQRSGMERYDRRLARENRTERQYKLYSEKYRCEFENYCLEEGLGRRCTEGMLLNENVAYTYMSILAEIISKETETDMITDVAEYSVETLRHPAGFCKKNMDMLRAIQREIQFQVPVDMYRIPLSEFIKLRSDAKFELTRRNFVTELNKVLASYDKGIENVDLNDFMECKKEVCGLIQKLSVSCAAVMVGVSSLGNMCVSGSDRLNFWENAGGVVISLDTLRNSLYGVREFARRIEGKRQARKYLAKLRQMR